jgi:hypothetical protein
MGLDIPQNLAGKYASGLFELGIQDEKDLRKFVSVWSLEKVGVQPSDIQQIMFQLYATTSEETGSGQS